MLPFVLVIYAYREWKMTEMIIIASRRQKGIMEHCYRIGNYRYNGLSNYRILVQFLNTLCLKRYREP